MSTHYREPLFTWSAQCGRTPEGPPPEWPDTPPGEQRTVEDIAVWIRTQYPPSISDELAEGILGGEWRETAEMMREQAKLRQPHSTSQEDRPKTAVELRARADDLEQEATDLRQQASAIENLLPCPFCGTSVVDGPGLVIKATDLEPWSVRCRCGARMDGTGSEAAAKAAWNRREVRP
jgi:hypothetical protein